MASLHDTLIEVRRDAEVTFMISGLEETDGENVLTAGHISQFALWHMMLCLNCRGSKTS